MILRNQHQPMYQQICDYLRLEIINGRYEKGEKFLSERDLASEFGVSRSTARRALQCLQELGLVRVTPQKRTCVI